MDLAVPGNEIKVAIRVRPMLQKEQAAGMKSRWLCTEKMISPDSSQSSNTSYIFDRVFDENVSNKMVYDELASDIVKQAMIGFNGTVFTYGQSGSGKTYTIDALRTFAIKSAYDYIENCPAREFLMRVSYIELYNEKLTDLLSDGSTTLTIREDYDRNVYIDGLQEVIVKSQDHVKGVLTQGNARRTFAETKLNERSSRAHCIFRFVIESRERDDPEHSSVYVSYLNLVDLAGSERAGENSGERLREGVSINLSLLTLSQVIRKLSGEQREFINYRDSKLTRILQNALEGNSKTAILCTVAPFSVEETHSTLRFALNAKKVKTKPQQNEVLTDSAMLKKSQLEITKLKNKIKELEVRNLVQDNDELQRRRTESEVLIKKFSSFLCVSSKARLEKQGFDKKRRETVCVPQMYRSADFKVPGIAMDVPKLAFSSAQPKQVESLNIPESPPVNDSVFGVSHSLGSPCASEDCSYCDLSFTGIEQAIVQESVLQKYKTKLKKYEAEIADLNRKLRQRSGMFITCRRDVKKNKSSGSEFLPAFCEEDEEVFASAEEHMPSASGRLDEDVENILEEKEALKAQNVLYQNEVKDLRRQLEALTVEMTQYDDKRGESEKNMAELSDRIRRDEEEIKKFKAREEEITLHYEEESKRWKEKVETLEWERSMQEMMKEEKGLLETTIMDKNEASERDLHEDLEMQKKELLNEWEEVSRLKEELNEQAISIEKTLCTVENDKEKLQKERDEIDREWNELEKANDDLRKEKEEFDQKQESVTERVLEVQEAASPHLGSDGYRNTEMAHMLENGTFVTSQTEDVMSESHVFSLVGGRYPKNITLQEEKEALLQELDSLRQSVCDLNARKCALESEMAISTGSKCEDNVECLPEKADMPETGRLQKEWEILRKTQEQLKARDIELSEQEAVSERTHDRCCKLEELNEKLEEEVQKWRSQHEQETVDVTIQERNVLSGLNTIGVELHADRAGKNRQVEHDTDMARAESSLHEEWKKLTKYQAELSAQEENVERKLDRLCMLEEEKEQFEEEKEQFYRDKECLREAEMDLMVAKEAFKQEQSKVTQELEQDGEGNKLNRRQLSEEEERLHEQWEHLRKLQEQFHQEREAFKQEQLQVTQELEQDRDSNVSINQLLKDEERLHEQWEHLRKLQEQFHQEREAFKQEQLQVTQELEQVREGNNVNRNQLLKDEERLHVQWEHLRKLQEQFHQEREVFKQEQLTVSQEPEKDREGNKENRNQLLKEEERLHEQWEHLRKLQEQFHQEREAFKQEQLTVSQEPEKDREGNKVNRNQLLKDEERLHVQWEQLRKLQEQFHREKEAFEQARAEDQTRETLTRDQETLNSEWHSLKQAQNDFRLEKEALEMSKVNVERNDLIKREDIGNGDRLTDNLSQADDESGIVTATSWDNSSLCCEFEEGSRSMSVCIHGKVEQQLQKKKGESREQWEIISQLQKGMNGKILSETGGEGVVQCLETCEESHSVEGKQSWQGITDNMEQAEQATKEHGLQYEEEKYTENTLDQLRTLHDEMGKLQLEKEQLVNEKVMFQIEKEQFQEVIDTLQRENKMLKGGKEGPQVGKESHLTARLENPQFSLLLNEHEGKIETFIPNEKSREVQKEGELLKGNENDFGRERTLLSEKVESLKEENQRLQKQIENLRQCQESLQQNNVLLIDPEHTLRGVKENIGTQDIEQMVKTGQQDIDIGVEYMGTQDIEQMVKTGQQDIDIGVEYMGTQDIEQMVKTGQQDIDIGVEYMGTQDIEQMVKTGQQDIDIGVEYMGTQDIEKMVKTGQQDIDIKDQDLETADVNEPDVLDETVRIQSGLSQSGCDISRYVQVSCHGEDSVEVCDLMTELKTAGFFIHEKKDRFDEEKRSLEGEWEQLKQAREELCSKEAALRDLEEDIVQRSDILHKFEVEQRILHENTSHLKQAEDILGRQQEGLKALEDSIKTELVRLLELQKEKEIIQIEIEKLIEDKMVLEKERGKLLEQREIGQEKNTDFHGDRKTCENDIEMTDGEKNILQREEKFMNETKAIIEENPEKCHLKNCIDQGKGTMFVAQQEHLQKEEEQLEMKKEALHIEEERLQKEKVMLEDMKAFLQEEADKLKTDKEVINEKAAVVQEEQARIQREQETLEKKKTDLEEHERLAKDFEERKAMHQKEQEIFQRKQETLEEQTAVLHEEQTVLQKEKESFKERNLAFKEQQERLEKEKEIIEQNIVLAHEQEERLHKEKGILEKKIAAFQKEQDEFQIKAQIFEEKDAGLQEMQDRLHKEKEMFEYENMTFQSEKEKFQKEKELCEEKNILCQEDQRRLQIEKETLQETIACLQEQQVRCQKETEMFQEEKKQLEEEKDRLQEEKDRLQETIADLHAGYQKETEILKEGNDRIQEETIRLQVEKDRLHEESIRLHEESVRLHEESIRLQEAKVNFQTKWDNFQMANNDLAKCREQLDEKEHLIESRMNHLSQFEKEKEIFKNEWDKLEKAREDLKHEKASLAERMKHHEDETRRLQEERDHFQQCREDLKQDLVLFLEKKKHFQEELESARDNLRQAQDKVTREEEALNKKNAEVEEKMQAVLEHERTLHDKESQCADEIATNSQPRPEELMEELQKLEDDLDNAYDKIDRLENLIAKGKAILAEKTEAVRQANDRVKELEEAVDGLKSNLASLNSILEAKSNECEKLKKVQDNYRIAVREQEGLKNEMEAMARGRIKDKEYYDDIIRQLKLKLRDTQNAESSFFVQRDPPNQCAPTLDQMRKIVEFENAAKFLELKELKQRVQEHEAKITDLEHEKLQLQAEIQKLQLLLDNETLKSEAMKSTASQKSFAKRKVEEELTQLRKQLGKGTKQNTDETPDEMTKMLRNQLQEKDQLIEQLSKSIDNMNMKWVAVSLRHKTLIEENHKLQKLVTELQKQIADCANLPPLGNVIRDSDDGIKKEQQTDVADLLKENSELKPCLEKVKLETHQQTPHKEDHLKQQQKQPSSSAESLHRVHGELPTPTETRHQPQQTQAFSVPSYRSGGGVESFVIAVKDREIRDLKKKLEKQSEVLKQVEHNTRASCQKSTGSEVKQEPEEQRHRRFQVNSTGKENIPFGM